MLTMNEKMFIIQMPEISFKEVAMNINLSKLEVLLAERGMTKAKLADSCGMSRQSISTILKRGTCEPRTAGKLAAGLGVSVEDIRREA